MAPFGKTDSGLISWSFVHMYHEKFVKTGSKQVFKSMKLIKTQLLHQITSNLHMRKQRCSNRTVVQSLYFPLHR